ncbi:signal peptidase I, partial [Mycobacterium sp. ITM-2017-0098]
MTTVPGSSDPVDSSAAERSLDDPDSGTSDGVDTEQDEPGKKKRGALREAAILVTIALVLYY